MHFWDFGGNVIDTPGVREFAMIDIEKEEVQHYFLKFSKERVQVSQLPSHQRTEMCCN
jgi:ribosome biogenesis GTPase